tara:strand:- start:397 stop:957 length:561 start_codon:yes stop_codon:yes gene_type:complete
MNRVCLLLVAIFLIGSVSGFELGISPSSFELEGNVGERRCQSVRVESSGEKIVGRDVWSLSKGKGVGDYELDAEDLNLLLEYDQELIFEQGGVRWARFCLTGLKEVEGHGILYYGSVENRAGVGSRIGVSVVDGGAESEKDLELSGRKIEGNKGRLVILWMLSVTGVEVLLFGLLLSKKMYVEKGD